MELEELRAFLVLRLGLDEELLGENAIEYSVQEYAEGFQGTVTLHCPGLDSKEYTGEVGITPQEAEANAVKIVIQHLENAETCEGPVELPDDGEDEEIAAVPATIEPRRPGKRVTEPPPLSRQAVLRRALQALIGRPPQTPSDIELTVQEHDVGFQACLTLLCLGDITFDSEVMDNAWGAQESAAEMALEYCEEEMGAAQGDEQVAEIEPACKRPKLQVADGVEAPERSSSKTLLAASAPRTPPPRLRMPLPPCPRQDAAMSVGLARPRAVLGQQRAPAPKGKLVPVKAFPRPPAKTPLITSAPRGPVPRLRMPQGPRAPRAPGGLGPSGLRAPPPPSELRAACASRTKGAPNVNATEAKTPPVKTAAPPEVAELEAEGEPSEAEAMIGETAAECERAFTHLLATHDEALTGKSMVWMVRSLLKLANERLEHSCDEQTDLVSRLKVMPWFFENKQRVVWQKNKNRINLTKSTLMDKKLIEWEARSMWA